MTEMRQAICSLEDAIEAIEEAIRTEVASPLHKDLLIHVKETVKGCKGLLSTIRADSWGRL